MTYVDELESDFSVYHRLDIWSVSFHRVMRMASKIVVYGGAVALAMERDARTEQTTPYPELPTQRSTAVDNSGDTPPEVVEQLKQQAMLTTMRARGVEVTEVQRITDDEMEGLVNGG